jgi:spermidine synthase
MFFYPKTVEIFESEINGEIKVLKLFGSYSMVVGKYTQSGGLLVPIWKKALGQHLNKSKKPVSKALILGLGAGSAAQLIRKLWPSAKIYGIEIDPVVIDIGIKYFNLDQISNLEIIYEDAFIWLKNQHESRKKTLFDLILVDLYIGKDPPIRSTKPNFMNQLKCMLTADGAIFYNRIVNKNILQDVKTFEKELVKCYKKVEIIPTPANKVFRCLIE